MKRIPVLTMLTALLALWTIAVLAAVPQLINFQGILRDGSGNPVANGPYSVMFTIYDGPGGGATSLWSETQSVNTVNGLFTVLLGSGPIPLDYSLFNDSTRWLGVKVGADPEMAPRQRLSSVGYSHNSSEWTSAAGNLFRLNGNVGIGTASPASKLEVSGGNAQISGGDFGLVGGNGYSMITQQVGPSLLQVGSAGGWTSGIGFYPGNPTEAVRITSSGNVGIGTASPTKKLEVAGSIKVGASDTVFTSNLSSNSPLSLQAPAGMTRMYINDVTGNVSIGTALTIGPRLNVYNSGSDPVLITGVKGEANNSSVGDAYGGYFSASTSGGGIASGVYASGGNVGVDAYGAATGVIATGGSYGVFGTSGLSGGAGVYGYNNLNDFTYGVYSSGDARVTRNLTIDGATYATGFIFKNGGGFRIDHPTDPANKYLYHSFVESPDMTNFYNGNVKLDAKGEATVELPDWFRALNKDFRYQLTAIGAPGPNLYIAEEVSGNRFKIAGGTAGMKVSWQVTGIRQDAYASAHRIAVEEEKTGKERGKYLQPKAHGVSETFGMNYEETQRMEAEQKKMKEQQAKMEGERKQHEEQRAKMEQERVIQEQMAKPGGQNK